MLKWPPCQEPLVKVAACLLVYLTVLLLPQGISEAESAPADAQEAVDDLAKAAADRFAHAVENADVAAATRECSLPYLNQFSEIASDAAGLKRSQDFFTDFARRHPEAGVYYRGIAACVPFDQFRQRLDAVGKKPDPAHPKTLENVDALKLTASDRVVLVNWMTAYSILVKVRDGKATVAGLGPVLPQEDPFTKKVMANGRPYRLEQNVVYGRKYGTALTLDVLTPKRGANRAAIIYIVSGDFVSVSYSEAENWVLLPLIARGYTVITVTHGSFPKYTLAEIVRDIYRAVRFVRFHAAEYGIDPNRIGATGESSGGYLALMLGTAHVDEPPLADGIDPVGKPDAIDAQSCRVQAAVCFFPPSDWLDYGAKNTSVLDVSWGGAEFFRSLLEPRRFDKAHFAIVPDTDKAKFKTHMAELSPARRVTKDSAPMLFLHGEKDPTVPLQQSQLMMERLKAAGVPAELDVKKGGGHGWAGTPGEKAAENNRIASWFDRYLVHRP